MLPDVGSTITDSPGRRRPSRSAASIIDSATRSFSEPPGLNCSHLQKISAIPGSGRWRSRTSGVPPMSSSMLLTATAGMGVSYTPIDRRLLSRIGRAVRGPRPYGDRPDGAPALDACVTLAPAAAVDRRIEDRAGLVRAVASVSPSSSESPAANQRICSGHRRPLASAVPRSTETRSRFAPRVQWNSASTASTEARPHSTSQRRGPPARTSKRASPRTSRKPNVPARAVERFEARARPQPDCRAVVERQHRARRGVDGDEGAPVGHAAAPPAPRAQRQTQHHADHHRQPGERQQQAAPRARRAAALRAPLSRSSMPRQTRCSARSVTTSCRRSFRG